MVEPDETLNSNRRIFIPAYDEPRIKEAPAEWELVVMARILSLPHLRSEP